MDTTIIYEIIREAWTYSLQSRAAQEKATMEGSARVTTTVNTLTAISVSGGEGGLQEHINKTSGKIQPSVNTQKVKPPRITYQIIGNQPSDTKLGASHLDMVQVQISCHAPYRAYAQAALADLRLCIDRFSGTVAGHDVQSVQYMDQQDQYSDKADLHGIAQEYKFRIPREW